MSEFEFADPGDDLSPEEMAELDRLNDFDSEESQFKWDLNFQRYILGMLLRDRGFAKETCDLIRPTYFTDEVHKLLCRILFDYIAAYNQLPPKLIILQEVQDRIKGKDAKAKYHYLTETNVVYDNYVPALESRKYLLDKITNFAKLQALKIAFNKSLFLIKKDPESDSTWSKIQSVLKDALLVDRNFEMGLDYFQEIEDRYKKMEENEASLEFFTSGFESIDKALIGGGPHRGEIYSWIGLPGTGKSLALVTAALRNVALGKKVLYISLEMDEYGIAERFDAQFSGININKLRQNKDLVKKALEEQVEGYDDRRLLVIKQFAAGTASVTTIRAFMQQLALLGFTPDLLILDYIGEMKDFPGMPTWESRYRIVRDLRGLATEENVCIFTAMQPNKDAREAQKKDGIGPGVIDDTHLADSFGQIRPLDGCWSINQTQAEKECAEIGCSIARIFVIKHRHGKSRFEFHVMYDKDTLQMTEISRAKYNEIWKKYNMEKKVTQADLEEQTDDIIRKKSKDFPGFQSDPGYEDPDDNDQDEDDGEGIPVK